MTKRSNIDCMPTGTREHHKTAHSGEKYTPKVIYIAGPMAGIENKNRPAFAEAADQLRRIGFSVLNPAVLPDNMPAERYMPICLAMVQAADIICMLPGWSSSRGACIELEFAKYQGKDVVTYLWLMGKEDA